jgi:type IV secretion system protein VirD4
MVSRTETARALLTPGEVMQLPPDDEIVMAAGIAPIRAGKARYFLDACLMDRVVEPPAPISPAPGQATDDWTMLAIPAPAIPPAPAANAPSVVAKARASRSKSKSQAKRQTAKKPAPKDASDGDAANAGIRREPEIPVHEDIAPPAPAPLNEFEMLVDDEGEAVRAKRSIDRAMLQGARQASLDPGDGIDL